MRNNRNLFIGLLICLLTISINTVSAQNTRVRGKITDAKTGELLPLVNVVFKGTTIGVTSDFDGNYFIDTREKVTDLQASFVGYLPKIVKVKPGSFNTVNFELEPQTFDLEELTVNPGENPAHKILKNLIRAKKKNNPSERDQYTCATYTRMELDITNMKPEFKNKKLQKNFGFIFNYVDTSVVTGKAYLPVMISEASADYYYRKSPGFSREVLKASRISGIEEDVTLAQFTGHLHANVNLYDNYINIFEVNFASPLSDHGLLYYKYFLVDSMHIEGRKTYKIRFHPKGTSTPVLDGEVNIDSTSWALQSAKAKMVKGLNINWLRDLVIENQSVPLGDTIWFPKLDKLFADFSIQVRDSSKLVSFLGHRQVEYSNVRFDGSIPDEVKKAGTDVVITNDVLKNDEEYWATVRPYELSDREKQIYSMVDSIKQVPLYQNIYDLIQTVLFGYYNTKYVGFGPYYKLYSFNKLEGSRFQLGARTTTDFSKKIRFSGYAAYSTKSDHFKGGAGIEYLFNELPTSMLTLNYKHDVLQLGAGVNALSTGNFLSSVLSRGNNDRLSLVDQFDASFEKEWHPSIVNTFAFQLRKIYSSPYVPFIRPDGTLMNSVRTSTLRLNTRISKNEIIVRNTFEKFSMGSDYPVIGIDLSMGIKGLNKEDCEYYRMEFSINHDFHVAPIGYSDITIRGGKIFGKVPYPLLKLHEGNASYFYDPSAYSCMNFYEFASDTWASLEWEHHFRGFFLGKIPLLKRLKWREVFIFKALIGTLSDKNNGSLPDTQAKLLFPFGMSSVSKPYFETGVGVENIFRVLRIDAIWRLSHRADTPQQNVQNFAINFSIHLNF